MRRSLLIICGILLVPSLGFARKPVAQQRKEVIQQSVAAYLDQGVRDGWLRRPKNISRLKAPYYPWKAVKVEMNQVGVNTARGNRVFTVSFSATPRMRRGFDAVPGQATVTMSSRGARFKRWQQFQARPVSKRRSIRGR